MCDVIDDPLRRQLLDNRAKPIITAKVKAGSEFFTDEYNIYNFAAEAGYKHRTVNHGAGEYARQIPMAFVYPCVKLKGVAFLGTISRSVVG